MSVPPLFVLAIYSNVPASAGDLPYSHPGELLWHRKVMADSERMYAADVPEEFFDPNANAIVGSDTVAWQYNFFLDPSDTFVQKQGEIYWLGVFRHTELTGDGVTDDDDLTLILVRMEQGGYGFGWKTSTDHYEDDAVWIDVPIGLGLHNSGLPQQGAAWQELVDPRTGESLDLAFVITPEPGTMALLGIGGLCVFARRRRC